MFYFGSVVRRRHPTGGVPPHSIQKLHIVSSTNGVDKDAFPHEPIRFCA